MGVEKTQTPTPCLPPDRWSLHTRRKVTHLKTGESIPNIKMVEYGDPSWYTDRWLCYPDLHYTQWTSGSVISPLKGYKKERWTVLRFRDSYLLSINLSRTHGLSDIPPFSERLVLVGVTWSIHPLFLGTLNLQINDVVLELFHDHNSRS